MIVVRYADDIVLGFEHEAEALRFQEAISMMNMRPPQQRYGRGRQVVCGCR